MFLATPAEVIDHYYCFLADSLSNDTFCQIMSSLKLLKEDDKITLSLLPSEYQRNTSLLNHLLVSDTTSICRFCHILQDTENQEIGYMLINGTYVCTYVCVYVRVCLCKCVLMCVYRYVQFHTVQTGVKFNTKRV